MGEVSKMRQQGRGSEQPARDFNGVAWQQLGVDGSPEFLRCAIGLADIADHTGFGAVAEVNLPAGTDPQAHCAISAPWSGADR